MGALPLIGGIIAVRHPAVAIRGRVLARDWHAGPRACRLVAHWVLGRVAVRRIRARGVDPLVRRCVTLGRRPVPAREDEGEGGDCCEAAGGTHEKVQEQRVFRPGPRAIHIFSLAESRCTADLSVENFPSPVRGWLGARVANAVRVWLSVRRARMRSHRGAHAPPVWARDPVGARGGECLHGALPCGGHAGARASPPRSGRVRRRGGPPDRAR